MVRVWFLKVTRVSYGVEVHAISVFLKLASADTYSYGAVGCVGYFKMVVGETPEKPHQSKLVLHDG